jgi:glycerol dehydrogenase-like iron-containing ADH family enzyme
LVIILKKNIRKIEIKKNKNRTGYKKTGLPNISPDIKLSPSNVIRAQPEDHKILQKSKKVECLIIPAYVLNRSINRILTIITENIFSF